MPLGSFGNDSPYWEGTTWRPLGTKDYTANKNLNSGTATSAAGSSASGSATADLVKQMLAAGGGGGSASAAGSAGGGGGAAGLSEIKTTLPGELDYASQGLKDLLAQSPQQSIERLGSNIRDWGARSAAGMTAGQAARGVTGTGVSELGKRGLESEMVRQLVGGSKDIESDFANKKAGILTDIAGVGTSKANIAAGDRDAAISLYNARESARIAEQNAELARQQAQWNLMMSALSYFG